MAADDGAGSLGHFRKATAENFLKNFRRFGSWKRDDGESRNRATTHGVNVAERIGCGNLTEKRRLVPDWREKIDGLHDGQIVSETIDGGVVTGFKTYQDVGIDLARQPF